MRWWPWGNPLCAEQRWEPWMHRLQRQLRQVKRAVAMVVATQRRLRRQLQRARSPEIRRELQQALVHQSQYCRRLQQQLWALEQEVQALQARQDMLAARLSTAEARKALYKLRQTAGHLPHLLQDTEDLVNQLEAEVELLDQSLGEWLPPVTGR